MKKIRLSHTLMSLWERGDYSDAVSTYFHLDRPITQPMRDGRRIHEEIEDHINKTGQFPEWFFNYPLVDPEAEKVVTVSYNELFDVKGLFDCIDGKTMFEFKTGRSDSLTWARTYQIPLYFLIAELAGIDVDKCFLIRWNQYEKKRDFCIVHNSEAIREKARNFVDSVGPEIHRYFEQEGLIEN
jgi:hypothetical protein